MSVIKIDNFGGMHPSASDRALGPGQARESVDLLATTSEFRPLQEAGQLLQHAGASSPVTVLQPGGAGAITDPRAIMRLSTADGYDVDDLANGWVLFQDAASTAAWPIRDGANERHSFTSESGAVQPKVFDSTGFVKLLGVPAPEAITTDVVVVNEYTEEEDTAARDRIPKELADLFKENTIFETIGSQPALPTGGGEGWVAHTETVRPLPLVTAAEGDYAYLVPMTAGALTDPVGHGYLLDPRFVGKPVTYDGHDYWGVNVTCTGRGRLMDGPAWLADAKAIEHPDPGVVRTIGVDYDSEHQMFTNGFLTDIRDWVLATYNRTNPVVASQVHQVEVASNLLVSSVVSTASSDAARLTTMAFYSKPDVDAEMDAARLAFATALFDAEHDIYPAADDIDLNTMLYFLTEFDDNLDWTTAGARVLDKVTLRAELLAGMTAVMDGDSGRIAQLGPVIDLAITTVDATVNVTHWNARADWPSSTVVLTAEQARAARASVVYDALVLMRTAAAELTYVYNAMDDYIHKEIVAKFASGLFAPVPAPTPSTPVDGDTVLLLYCDGADGSTTFTDETGKTLTVRYQAYISTNESKSGGASAYFDGSRPDSTRDSIFVDSTDFIFNSGAFTVELWFYRVGAADQSYMETFIDFRQNISTTTGFSVGCRPSGEVGTYGFPSGTSWEARGTLIPNQFNHVAVVSTGTVGYMFLNGVQTWTGSVAGANYTDARVTIGSAFLQAYGFKGYIDDVRVSKVARYTADFTPPVFSSGGGGGGGGGGGTGSIVLPKPTTRIPVDAAYVYTFVTDWGEESAPSPASDILTTDQNDTATITRTNTLPTGRGTITHWRLYRTNSSSTTTEFQFVAEIPIATTSFTDTVPAKNLGEVIPSLTWLEPPVNMRGITAMANGVHAGFFENTLCFCEPYHPYAWPIGYQLTVKNPIVGIAAFGQNLFVGTRGAPYIVSGADSASMSMLELPGGQPCVSARSIVATDYGAIYASPDGLCLATANGVEVITAGLFAREDWQGFGLSDLFAAMHDSVYYFVVPNSNTENTEFYALDFVAKKLVRVGLEGGGASALYSDKVTDMLCSARDDFIHAVFELGRRTGVYRTGVINTGAQRPFAWLQVDSTFDYPVTVRWYGDGVLRHTATVTGLQPQRLPAGRYLEHQIEIESQARITSVTLAGSTEELQAS